MNYNKHEFTKEEFLDLPVFPEAKFASANTDFLLGSVFNVETTSGNIPTYFGKMTRQKEALLSILEEFTKANVVQLNQVPSHGILKVRYWHKYADGNVGERGGHILLDKIVQEVIAYKVKSDSNSKIDLKESNGILTIETGA